MPSAKYNATGRDMPAGFVRQAADIVFSNSIAYAATDLTLPLEPNSTYVLRAQLVLQNHTTPDAFLRWSYSGSSASYHASTVIAALAASTTQYTDRATSLPHVLSLGQTNTFVIDWNMALQTTTAGNFYLEYAQQVLSATTQTIYAGAWLAAQIVAQ
jgi:hypothetical protein